MQEGEEGCLSFPGLYFHTPRSADRRVLALRPVRRTAEIKGREVLARCLLHEPDHLDGILFLDRLDREQRKAAMKAIREAEWAGGAAPVVKVSPHAHLRPGHVMRAPGLRRHPRGRGARRCDALLASPPRGRRRRHPPRRPRRSRPRRWSRVAGAASGPTSAGIEVLTPGPPP